MNITEEEIKKGLDKAYKEAGHNAYFGNGFELGVKFALEQVNNLDLADINKRAWLVGIVCNGKHESIEVADAPTELAAKFVASSGFINERFKIVSCVEQHAC